MTDSLAPCSRLFAVLVDEVLRGRFSMITSCNTTELIVSDVPSHSPVTKLTLYPGDPPARVLCAVQ